jgi:hypothetical protein
MDSKHFDQLARVFGIGAPSTRRAALGILAALGLGSSLADDADAKRRKKKKCKNCGPCRKCKRGKCKPKPDGTACGACATCLAGQCVAGCPDGQICQGNTCECPPGQKPCQGGCIADSQCCGGCPQNQVCCTNLGECKDTRNDADFCGQCANGQCPGGAICANGECGLTCNTVGQACFGDTCFCGNRVDPNHAGQQVCAEISPFTCDTVTTCDDDADCAPATLGFREICVSGLCAGKNVCADPCA